VQTRSFKVIVEWDPGDAVWVTSVPALNHLSTYGATRAEALAQTREAILGYLEAAALEGLPIEVSDTQVELVEVEVVTT
jgi:predicted RNase H-like HicB family nuclease